MPARTHSDEPTAIDLLERKKYAHGLARLAESGATPMVIGIYGTWGMGKTSLMRLIEMELDRTKIRPLWFNPWEHQFDDNPVVALVYKIMEQTGRKWEQTAKETLALFAAALASGAVKYFTDWKFSLKDLLHLGKHYFENQFLVRDFHMKLRDKFADLVKKVRTEGYTNRRLVFFIDDLDRCLDDQALKMLEALKLYLNLEGCVFFLGLNREAMEAALRSRYPDLDTRADYLDKIIQLPFHLPPIDAGNRKQFVGQLLGQELASCGDLLAATLGENPRKVKRFINKLIVNDSLAQALAIPAYDVRVLALILLIQDAHYPFYLKIAEAPERLQKLQQVSEDDETKALAAKFLDTSERLTRMVNAFAIPAAADITPYIHLTRVTRVEPEAKGYRRGNIETGEELGDRHHQGQVSHSLANLIDHSLPQESEEFFRDRLQLLEETDDLQGQALLLNRLGDAYLDIKEPAKAVKVLEVSVRLSPDLSSLPIILNTLGNAYLALREPVKAAVALEECTALARNAGNLEQLAISLNTLGTVYLALRDPEKAIAALEESVRLAVDDASRAMSLNTLGTAYLALRPAEPKKAVAALEESVRLAADPAQKAMSLNTLGTVYLALKKPEEAVAALEENVRIAPDPASRAMSLNTLGTAYLALKKPEETAKAVAALEKAVRLDPDDASRAKSLNTLGTAYLALRPAKPEKAVKALEEAVKIDPDPASRAMMLNTLGSAYLKGDHPEAAIAKLQESLKLVKDSHDTRAKATAYNLLGQSYEKLPGKQSEAIAAYRAAEALNRGRGGDRRFAEMMARNAARLEGEFQREGGE